MLMLPVLALAMTVMTAPRCTAASGGGASPLSALPLTSSVPSWRVTRAKLARARRPAPPSPMPSNAACGVVMANGLFQPSRVRLPLSTAVLATISRISLGASF